MCTLSVGTLRERILSIFHRIYIPSVYVPAKERMGVNQKALLDDRLLYNNHSLKDTFSSHSEGVRKQLEVSSDVLRDHNQQDIRLWASKRE